ncbi:MAG: hypothetical protein Q8P02_01140, partial [Candidatus Micrarchaeota archaeon]|nr:hypothetical protein [Candidatus Micrarchaeota archaeon]
LSACLATDFPDACAGVFALRTGSKQVCASWRDSDACRHFYLSALLSENPQGVNASAALSQCNALADNHWRYACLERHAQILQDIRFCQAMEVYASARQCIGQVSKTA